MDFYLTAPDGSRIHFPVNPERITCDTGNRILTFDVIALGEISLPRGRVPTRFSFEGFFPGEACRNDPMVKSWRSPKELAGILSETFIMGLAELLKAVMAEYIYLLEEPILSLIGGNFVNLYWRNLI